MPRSVIQISHRMAVIGTSKIHRDVAFGMAQISILTLCAVHVVEESHTMKRFVTIVMALLEIVMETAANGIVLSPHRVVLTIQKISLQVKCAALVKEDASM